MSDPGLVARLAEHPIDLQDEQQVARAIEAWHDAEDVDVDLHEWLGWSWRQWDAWVREERDRTFDSSSDAASWTPPNPKPAPRSGV
jgi:hypothetical protein